jgi:uncharacterized protein (TIGR00251 family)
VNKYARLDDGDLVLHCHIQPGAKRSELAGEHGERLKIRLQAPPVDGKANTELVRFLGKLFGVPRSAIQIESGELSRQKRVRIRNPVQWPAGIDKPVES